jgi:hypothetical protein
MGVALTPSLNAKNASSTGGSTSGTSASDATQKENAQGTDGSFVSILASFSGIMLPVAPPVSKPGASSKKSANDMTIGYISHAKAGLSSGKAIPVAKSDLPTNILGMPLNGSATQGKQKLKKDLSANGDELGNAGNATADDSTAFAKIQDSSKPGIALIPGTTTDTGNGIQAEVQAGTGKLAVGNGQQKLQIPQFLYLMNQPAAGTQESVGAGVKHSVSASGPQQGFGRQLSGQSTIHTTDSVKSGKPMLSGLGGKESSGTDSNNPDLSGINPVHSVVSHASGVQSVHGQAQSHGQVNTLDVSQPGWMSNFGQIVGHVSNDNGGTIQVKVHPEGMGDLLISVSNSAAGLSIHVEANQFSTAQWLGQQTGQLTNAVSQLGISVANVQVGFGQTGFGQPGNGQSSRKSNDSERHVQSITGVSDSSALIQEPVALSDAGQVYSHNSSITFRA